MPSKKYTAEVLAPIVASSHSLSDVIRALGLVPNGGNHRMIAGHVRRHGLDTSHFKYGTFREQVEAIPIDVLRERVTANLSMAAVLESFSLPTVGRAHHTLRARLANLDIDTHHFRGQGWSRGETADTQMRRA